VFAVKEDLAGLTREVFHTSQTPLLSQPLQGKVVAVFTTPAAVLPLSCVKFIHLKSSIKISLLPPTDKLKVYTKNND
jgi:hypothetical protein